MAQTIPPILSVLPTRALVDEKFKVVVENLPPGSPVTLHSLHRSEDKDYWEAFGHYISDHRGVVSVAEDLSFGGTYTGIEVMGLLWSMRPVPGSRTGLRLRKMNVCTPMLVNISVCSGHLAEGFREQSPLASVLTERWYMAPGVRRIDIREKAVRGTLFIPPGPGPFPGVLDMWGGGGGLVEYRSSLLASHGYASFALEYFAVGEISTADVGLSYFETAFNILKDHPQVIPDRIGIFGFCLGSMVTMYVTAESTVVKPFCCVCVSGLPIILPGFTVKGVYEISVKHSNQIRVDENNHHIWRNVGLKIMKDPSNKVDVGKINCPLLLVNGHDDQNCAIVEAAEDIAQMMNVAGKEHLLTRVLYPDAGHLIEPPFSPHFRATTFMVEAKSKALVDEKFKVVVENLPPGSPVTLHSLHHSEDKDYWEAFGHYISDHRGVVSEDLSFGGTYTGIEVMGLLWSMRPVPGSRTGLRLRKMNVCTPMLVNISVYSGHLAEGFREQSPLASVLTERWYMAPGVRRIDIREKAVRGTLFIPPGPGPFPGVLDMWGGGGGLVEYRSSLLASHGYASFALEYFAVGEMSTADVGLSYFETAFNILKDHPQVIPDRIGIFGISLGSLVTLYVAAESTVVKPLCCVCVSGFHLILPGFNMRGMHEMLVKHSNMIHVDENNHHRWRNGTLSIMKDPSNKLHLGKINCPLLLVCGHDDQNCAAVESAEDIAQMMKAAGKKHLLTRVLYPDAGHLIEPPFSPHFRATNFKMDTKTKAIMLWGGQTKPHSDAKEDSWRKILAFLQHHLYSSTTSKAKM